MQDRRFAMQLNDVLFHLNQNISESVKEKIIEQL